MSGNIVHNNNGTSRRSNNKKGFKRKLDESLGITKEVLLSGHSMCNFFMEHKRRFCGVARIYDSLFCGTHCIDQCERIPCPVDSTHTIFKNKTEQHVKICNASKDQRKMETESFYCLNCNSGSSVIGFEEKEEEIKEEIDPEALWTKITQCFDDLSIEGLMTVKSKDFEAPQSVYEKFIEETVLSAVAVGQSSFKQLRHAKQDAQIVYEMFLAKLILIPSFSTIPPENEKREDFTAKNTIYVELGAGRGVLGQSVSRVTPSSSLVLVERAGQRRKAEREMKSIKFA